jgi:hypothetical protein
MDCKALACTGFDKTRVCRCYSKPGKEEQQFCGYNKNGLIIPCGPGCCDKGCPGQCKGVAFRPPYAFDTNVFDVEKFPEYLKVSIVIVIVLLVLSTLRA